MSPDDISKYGRIARLNGAFSPSAPVDEVELFSYRDDQVQECIAAIFQRGRHIALYGERGVGKTSLANILPRIIERMEDEGFRAGRIDCNHQDSFTSLWRKVGTELSLESLNNFATLDPEDIRRAFQKQEARCLVVIDELDRMEDDDGLSLLADTIKTLSDHSVGTTIMLVGVADSLVALLGEHLSIVRSLIQVRIPRMSVRELEQIIDKGFDRTDLTIEGQAKARIISMAEGLPHFVHLLAQGAGERTINDDRHEVTLEDVHSTMGGLVKGYSYVDEYQKATSSPQPGNLFEQVLLACAYARRDDLGFFRPADVREPLSIILEKNIDIPHFQNHLRDFPTEKRGFVLQREGKARSWRYRFRNPLLQPYAKIQAVSKGILSESRHEELERRRKDDPGPQLNPGVQEDLF